ncbi:MAG: DinB family protein [Ignavibacteriaceae bacterium]
MENDMDLLRYLNNYNEIFHILKNLSNEQINYKPAENKWSVHEIITHLADTEVQSHVRFRTILANKVPYMVYFDEMDWSIILEYTQINSEESLEVIKLMRRVNYNLLSRLKPEDFNKRGIHSTRGELTLKDLVNSYINHVDTHLVQINRNINPK